jgi:opacity protein-like surface antigen
LFTDKASAINKFLIFIIFLFFTSTVFAENRDLKETLFNSAHSDERIIYSTDPLSQNGQQGSSKSLYLQFNTSGLYPSLTNWKNQFHLSDGTRPSVTCMIFGAEGGWVANRYIQLSIGYEFFFTTKVTTVEATGDQINSTFFYGSVRGCMPLESVQDLSLFAGIDIGSLATTEVMENYYGLNYNRTGSTIAYRFMLGAQYYLIDNWSIMAGTGYLFGKVNNVIDDKHTLPNITLDLSGIVLRFAVNYHFPL